MKFLRRLFKRSPRTREEWLEHLKDLDIDVIKLDTIELDTIEPDTLEPRTLKPHKMGD